MGILASKLRRTLNENFEPETDETEEKQPKLIVLGTAGSGKTTICQQMSISRLNLEENRAGYRWPVQSGIIGSMGTILTAMKTLGVQFDDPERLDDEKQVQEHFELNLYHDKEEISSKTWDSLERLWEDRGIKACVKRSNEYRLKDNAPYFLNNMERMRDKNYIPTTQDIIHAYFRTTGKSDRKIIVNAVNFTLIDIGGRRSERKKWVHTYREADAILYIAGIADYNKVLAEDGETKQLDECLKLWEDICSFPLLKETQLVLVLNKQDLLKTKLENFPLSKYHCHYQDGNTFDDVVEYIRELYLQKARKYARDVPVYLACALDTEEIHSMFGSVLNELGFTK